MFFILMFNLIIAVIAGIECVKHFQNGENKWGWITLLISALNAAVFLNYVL